MRLSKRRRAPLPLMNMTPMIDVVFLLLIFFMTVSQVSQINRERLQLPKEKGDAEQQASVITLNVTEDGRVIVSGGEVSVARVLRIVVDQLERLGNDPSRLTVVLRADERSDSTTVNRIVSGLAELQLNRVRIAVEAADG
ncbi:MAG TPA: biopolymer transporter ExbD [Thermoguttaceae bacterium]|nr:biopolymer transporter ExbD [Thermoguttaceae bacterium]